MKTIKRVVLGGLGAAVLLASAVPASAPAHRSGCHPKYACPSDHATYKWRGMYCVKPSSDKRDARYRKKVRYDGLTYFCRR